MNSEIVKTLELMCDKNEPRDKKLLLLAELVESKCEALADNQAALKKGLDLTNEKLDKLTDLLEKYERNVLDCPVYKNRKDFEGATFLLRLIIKYPKITLLIVLGLIALMTGFFSSSFLGSIKLFL